MCGKYKKWCFRDIFENSRGNFEKAKFPKISNNSRKRIPGVPKLEPKKINGPRQIDPRLHQESQIV